ncbi:MAG: twin-arginine translocase subunit TatC [Acidobacteriia bacterium]|nr:twin-arginine translocase subunit TatC [Terriglobia bacterium]
MLRMSFLEHLEELRKRILHALIGIGVAFAVSLYFVNDLWAIISEPAMAALRQNGVQDPKLAMLTPTESFSVIWVKLPILTAIFLSSPWLVYQVWSFIAPGLYKKERRWAVPFILSTAGLFICGGLFAYFVAFRLGLGFLLGIGVSQNVMAVVSITEYFDLFVNVTLGLGLVFELPILIFFLSLLRIVTPQFLIRNSRYAILLITLVAAIITPTPDVINLMLISVPMALLYFVGVFASYLLWLSRENKRFPWLLVLFVIACLALIAAGGVYLAVSQFGYSLVLSWPYIVR